MPSQIENFTLQDLAAAQRQHYVWNKIIFAVESGDDTSLPPLPVFFTIFLVSGQGRVSLLAPQYLVPECCVPAVLNLKQDTVVAGVIYIT